MPRVKVNPDELLVLELRITPPDGQPISDWQITDKDFKQVIAAQEGGTPELRLHYHAYVECLRSRSWLIKWIYSIARCTDGQQGNSVFFTRKPHDNTIGYVVKSGNITVRHGCSETFITEWLNKSDEYRRAKDASRKRRQRIEKSFTQEVRIKVDERLKESPDLRSPDRVLDLILQEYQMAHKVFPNRSTIENLIVTCLHPYLDIARAFYLRNFESR